MATVKLDPIDTAFNERQVTREEVYKLEAAFFALTGRDLVDEESGPLFMLADGELVRGWSALLAAGRKLMRFAERQVSAA